MTEQTTTRPEVTELPDYRALFVADMRGFGSVPGRDHAQVTQAIPGLLRNAFQHCGLGWLWEKALFQDTTGDGYFLCFASRYVPFLLNPLLSALQDTLEFQNSLLPHPIRMRVSVTVGPLADTDAESISRGSGTTRVETHRLLDSSAVRSVLDDSGPETCVAAIVPERVVDDVVAAGYSAEGTSLYHRVEAREKEYHGVAYLRVPKPSGGLLAHGFTPRHDTEPDTEADRATPEAGHSTGGTTATHVDGPVAQHGSRVTTGVDVSGSGNTITTVHGDQHRGPRYEGDGQIHVGGNNAGVIKQTMKGRRAR